MRPDMVVFASDRPEVSLVVEVKASSGAASEHLEQLKVYMLARRCPVGLLVTPDTTFVLRDTYVDISAAAVAPVAEIPTTALLGPQAAVGNGEGLERLVFEWLERLAASWATAVPHNVEAAAAVTEYLVPAVAEGRVTFMRAA